jgi:hypothetical protein
MTIAELFVTLGIKGADKSKKDLAGVDKSMKGIVSSGLAVKAGLLAMAYGLQNLMRKASTAGAQLNQFRQSTGLSAEKLQKWQYAARQFNVDSDEMTSSVKNVQDAMTSMLMGKGAPEGFGMVANMVDIDPNRVRDTFYVLEKLQEFAKQVPADVSKSMMKSFGLSEGVIAAMRQGGFNQKAFNAAPIYSDGEIESLRKLNVGWANLFDKIDKSIGALNARHGGQLMKDITMIANEAMKLIDIFAKFSKSAKLFEGISLAFKGWTEIFKLLNSYSEGLMQNLSPLFEYFGSKDENKDFGKSWKKMSLNVGDSVASGASDLWNTAKFIGADIQNALGGNSPVTRQNQMNFNQTLNFKDTGDPQKNAELSKKAFSDAYRQMNSQRQEN